MSTQGPAAATTDVDKNGRVDVFIGGATQQAAALLLQQENGSFLPSNEALWENHKFHEDVAAVFFDIDQDEDQDLLVGGGSNEWPIDDTRYGLRLYLNDGDGNFSDASHALPNIKVSLGTLAVGDFNADGKMDVFVGGRQVPGKYPQAADSYLLINQGTGTDIQLSDQTAELAPFLTQYGMVTDASWQDINGDQQLDLITVGEWMSPRILLQQNGKLVDHTPATQLDNEIGWWYSLAVADMDADGDLDLVAGNLGLNYKYQASKAEPFEIFSTDFDQNGSQDIVLGYHNEGKLFPLRGRECSSGQMPFIKEKFPTYDAFAKATITEVYGEAELGASVHYSANNFAHTYFENDGTGSFTSKALPIAAQLSAVNSILIDDFDNDNKLDILCAGNLYGSEVETPRNDASYGHLLRGTNKGEFLLMHPSESGLRIKGEVKKLLSLSAPGAPERRILVVKNNSPTEILKQP